MTYKTFKLADVRSLQTPLSSVWLQGMLYMGEVTIGRSFTELQSTHERTVLTGRKTEAKCFVRDIDVSVEGAQ